jgi:hypothetical protein
VVSIMFLFVNDYDGDDFIANLENICGDCDYGCDHGDGELCLL